MKEKIILQADVEYLGLAGEQVEVAKGYARNYLYPKGFAVPSTPANEKMLAAMMASVAERKKRIEDKARERAAELEGLSLTIAAKVGEKGKLFGSVTTMDLAKALSELGQEIDRKKIELKDHIKSIGEYEAPVRLEAGVTATIRFLVVDEAKPRAEAEEEARSVAQKKVEAEEKAEAESEAEAEAAPAEEATESPTEGETEGK